MDVFETEYVRIEYFPEHKLKQTTWKSFANSQAFHEVLAKNLEFVKEHEVTKTLSDNRQMRAIRPADQEYVTTVYLPQYLKYAKIEKSAIVISEDIFNRMAIDEIIRKASPLLNFEIRHFTSVEEAWEWLING